jgi:hypothetical protein
VRGLLIAMAAGGRLRVARARANLKLGKLCPITLQVVTYNTAPYMGLR